MKSIVNFLELHSRVKAADTAFTFIEDDGIKNQISFLELHQSAIAVAGFLLKKVNRGDVVVLLLPQGLEYIQVFMGCLYAGVIAVPLYPPHSTNHSERVLTVIKDCNARLAFTSDHLKPRLEQSLHSLSVIGFSEMFAEPVQVFPTKIVAEDLAFLQYTSGSTGTPKGVMVSHGNILANSKSLQEAAQSTEKDIYCNWLPLFHDFGLMNTFMVTIYLGCHSVLMSPARFIKRPLAWFEAITEYKGTICGAPNFAYDHCVSRISDDHLVNVNLSSLRIVASSAEPVDAKTIEKFIERFAQVGFKSTAFYPCYGMAESTLVIAGGAAGSDIISHAFNSAGLQIGIVELGDKSNASQVLVSCGKALSNHSIKIVDPILITELPDDHVGEIWFSGPSVAQGYWNDVEKTTANFGVRLPDDDKGYLRTGDLGFIHQGQLYISGRIKDVLIIKGKNYYPQDLEKCAFDSFEGLIQGGGAAFDVEGKAILIHEVDARAQKQFEYASACRSIQFSTFEQFDILFDDIVFIRARKLSRTSSGKIQRSLTKNQYLSGDINFLYSLKENADEGPKESAEPTVLENQLCDIWREILGAEYITADDNFFSLGGHSLLATRLVSAINASTNSHISIKDLFFNPTARELAKVIEVAQPTGVQSIFKRADIRESPLSFAQERLWFLEQINDGTTSNYNLPFCLTLKGSINRQLLELTFSDILERHESLRTCFAVGADGQPVQFTKPAAPFNFQTTDLCMLDEGERCLKLAELIAEESSRMFDLTKDVLLRGRLIKTSADEHVALMNIHHIASDGWSMSILINEINALYSAYVQGKETPLAPLPIQYADYAHWQRNWLQGEVLDNQLDYWSRQLAGLPVVHSVPLDHARPQLQTFSCKTVSSHIPVQTHKALHEISQAQGATLFMGLHAAFAVLLSRYSNETDIVIGSFIANREQKEISNLIGFFINSLVLRSDLSGHPTFNKLLKQSRQILLDAYTYQQVPFEKIVERLQPERSLNHSALFQIMLILQNNEEGRLELPNVGSASASLINTNISEFDLTLEVKEEAEGLRLDWKYNTDLFEEYTITRMATHFELLLNALIEQPDTVVFELEMLNAQERRQLLSDWNNTHRDYPQKCIHELFESQVEKNSNSIAVVFEGEQLTYGELNQKANQLAHYLIDKEMIRPDTLVGICVERSLDMMVGILAILKAGGAYVPLDPAYPEARLKYMLDDARLKTVLTQLHLRETTPVTYEQAVYLDAEDIQQQIKSQSTQNPNVRSVGLKPDHLAYVIYTSGSTGNPKGVMIIHRGVVNLVEALRDTFQLTNSDSILQFAPMSFDMSVEEMFGALCNGCSLVLRTDAWIASANQFWQRCASANITVLNLPTAFWHELARDKSAVRATSVRHISIGGEKINNLAVSEWFEKNSSLPALMNAYGPTECTVNASFSEITRSYGNSIGKALHNIQLLVMNAFGVLSPVGVSGELHLGGVGLARGYLNRPDLTAEKFIPNPFYDETNPASSERLYKTGDLVRWLADGNLEFLGRVDHQVKIRGFRIELGEIESTLNAYPIVKDTVVIAKESASGDKHLVAYVKLDDVASKELIKNDSAINSNLVELLHHHLKQQLPEYMTPSAFVFMEEFPLTPNGKIDRKALPEPVLSSQQHTYVAPRSETEKILCEIWQDILGVKRVGITDNFFALGGHSLLAMKLMAKLQQIFAVTIPAKTLFHGQVIVELAEIIDKNILIENNKDVVDPDLLEEVEW